MNPLSGTHPNSCSSRFRASLLRWRFSSGRTRPSSIPGGPSEPASGTNRCLTAIRLSCPRLWTADRPRQPLLAGAGEGKGPAGLVYACRRHRAPGDHYRRNLEFIEGTLLGLIWPSSLLGRTLMLEQYLLYELWDGLRDLAEDFRERPFFLDWHLKEPSLFHGNFNGVDEDRFPSVRGEKYREALSACVGARRERGKGGRQGIVTRHGTMPGFGHIDIKAGRSTSLRLSAGLQIRPRFRRLACATPKQNSTGGKEKFGDNQAGQSVYPTASGVGRHLGLRAAPKRKGALCDWLAASERANRPRSWRWR